ncbi:MAG: thioesterase family protein [Chloroflexota bacterium]|nr:thioesterase family protein [Chloroflexota bacterium]
MARVTIDLPEKFPFSFDIEVRMSDVNAGAHLGNHLLIAMLNEAHLKFMKHIGFPDILVDGKAFINVDMSVIYKSESFYGDILQIEVAAGDFGKYGCDIVCRVTNKTQDRLAAIAKLGMIFFDYETRKIAGVPEAFKKAVG